MPIRIGIIHDDKSIQSKLIALIEAQKSFFCLDFTVASITEMNYNSILDDFNPDIVLLDMDMHGDSMAGFKVIDLYVARSQRKRMPLPVPKIIVISQWSDPWMVKIMETKKEMGICGCITTDNLFNEEVLRHLLLTVHYGQGFITNDDKNIKSSNKEIVLTTNQKDILRRMMQGKRAKTIADELNIAESTVNVTIFKLRKTFGVDNNGHLSLAAQHLV
jgi:DNA-binding NarL/FixJ family response regulator